MNSKFNGSHITKCASELGFSHIEINVHDVENAKSDEVVQVYNELLFDRQEKARKLDEKQRELADKRIENSKLLGEIENLKRDFANQKRDMELEVEKRTQVIEDLKKACDLFRSQMRNHEARINRLTIDLKSAKKVAVFCITAIRKIENIHLTHNQKNAVLTLVKHMLFEITTDTEDVEEIQF